MPIDRMNTLTETEMKILSSFFPEGKEITLKKIMERSAFSYEPVYRTVNQLVDKKLISVKKFGKTFVYSLDFTKDAVKVAFILYANKRKETFSEKYGKVARALSKVDEEDIELLAVFGSYAKGHPRKESDVDILAVSTKKDKGLKSLRHETNLDFAPVVLPKTEFAKIKEENETFWKDLITYVILFKGYELFYYYAYVKWKGQ